MSADGGAVRGAMGEPETRQPPARGGARDNPEPSASTPAPRRTEPTPGAAAHHRRTAAAVEHGRACTALEAAQRREREARAELDAAAAAVDEDELSRRVEVAEAAPRNRAALDALDAHWRGLVAADDYAAVAALLLALAHRIATSGIDPATYAVLASASADDEAPPVVVADMAPLDA